MSMLLQFLKSYLCELWFSTLTTIKCKMREIIQCIDEEMRVCVSNQRQIIEEIAKTHQTHASHEHNSMLHSQFFIALFIFYTI